ncbi:MAG: hypothetical protein Q9161_001857 [Pseudevernia consocians]
MAMPLHSTYGQATDLSTVLNSTSLDLLVPSEGDIQDLNASYDIRCDGARYGFNPSLSDCEGARSSIPPDSEQFNFGERHTGLPPDTFPLPYIIMGDKAECFFQTEIIGGGATARASLFQVRSAASALFLKCASNHPSQGGIVTNIGGDNNIAVTMRVFEPKVRCRGSFETAASCKDVLADMPASTDLEVFGPRDTPFVKEILPQDIVSEDDKCIVRLYSTGRSDVVAWYQIWEAVEATFAMCGRSYQGGSYRELGESFLRLSWESEAEAVG